MGAGASSTSQNVDKNDADRSVTCRSVQSVVERFSLNGDLVAMRELYLLSIEEYTHKLGASHMLTREAMNALAGIYIKERNLEEAERMHTAVLKTTRNALGDDHPETLKSCYNLGGTLFKATKYEEASIWFLRCFHAQEQMLGSSHPDTILSLQYLVLSLAESGRYYDAESLLKSTIDKLLISEGSSLYMIDLSFMLCAIYDAQGRVQEAIVLCQDSIEMCKLLEEGEGAHLLKEGEHYLSLLLEGKSIKSNA
eukprot:gene5485-6039_t